MVGRHPNSIFVHFCVKPELKPTFKATIRPSWIFLDSPLFLGPVLDFTVSWILNPQNLIS